MSAAFDAASFVADLRAVGLTVGILRDVPRGGERAEPPTYFVRSAEGQGLGSASGYPGVLERWHEAMTEHPDYIGAVVAHLVATNGWETGTRTLPRDDDR